MEYYVEEVFKEEEILLPLPAFTVEQIKSMLELGRQQGDEIADRLEKLFLFSPEDMLFIHQ